MLQSIRLKDGTEFKFSDVLPSEQILVYVGRPMVGVEDGIDSALCYLPQYKWDEIEGFTDDEIDFFQEILEINARLIMPDDWF